MRRYRYTWDETGTVTQGNRRVTSHISCEVEVVHLSLAANVKCVMCNVGLSPAEAYWISAEDSDYDADTSMPIDAQPVCMDCIVQLADNRDSLLGRE